MTDNLSVTLPPPAKPIPQTSLCTRGNHPDEVTLRFTRWTAVAGTAYQKGQHAGFLRPVAANLVKQGRAVLVQGTL